MPSAIDDQVRAIRMGLHAAPAFIVVEGQTDKALLKRLIHDSVVMVVAGGKEALYEVAGQLNSYSSVMAIADQDYDLILGRATPPNVAHWEFCDAEATCFLRGGLDFIVDSFCSSAKVDSFCKATGASLSDVLVARLSAVGALRLVSARERLNLPFASISLSGFIDKDTLEVDLDRWAVALLSRAQRDPTQWSQLRSEVHQVLATQAPEQLIRGHDLAVLLAGGVRSSLGSRKASVDELAKDIEIAIRGTLQTVALRTMAVGQRVCALEDHLGVPIFR
jgi:hypothetical protein